MPGGPQSCDALDTSDRLLVRRPPPQTLIQRLPELPSNCASLASGPHSSKRTTSRSVINRWLARTVKASLVDGAAVLLEGTLGPRSDRRIQPSSHGAANWRGRMTPPGSGSCSRQQPMVTRAMHAATGMTIGARIAIIAIRNSPSGRRNSRRATRNWKPPVRSPTTCARHFAIQLGCSGRSSTGRPQGASRSDCEGSASNSLARGQLRGCGADTRDP